MLIHIYLSLLNLSTSYSFNFSDYRAKVANALDLFNFLLFAKLGFKLLLELLSRICSSPAVSIIVVPDLSIIFRIGFLAFFFRFELAERKKCLGNMGGEILA